MDSVATLVLEYQTKIAKTMKHNHPPMTGIIPNCNHCIVFGNLFKDGPVPLHENTCLCSKMFCLQ